MTTALSPTPMPKRELYWVFGALMLGMLLAALDQTIVSTALPTIVGDLHGANHLSWVVVAYLLASTVTTPLWGKLGDLYGRKGFFQWAIVIFLVGSMLCGLAHSMFMLILFRALQGLGGGGLMVGAQAVIADIVPPSDRGRYAGFFGAVFGAATVLGPLLGGVIVDSWSWRWIFFVNLPFGILALIVTAAALPNSAERRAHVIDYPGIVTLTLGASGLILFLSLGGSKGWAWGSAQVLMMAVAGVIFTIAFGFIERRSVEPILAPRLFRNRAFVSGSAIGFVVGFAMFGAMTFLPLFLQDVRGVSPTSSGLRLLPMMVGLFGASITAGQLVSRGWRYRPFPIVGSAVMTIGLGLMGLVGITTSNLVMSLYMFILGAGLGLVMQILVTAVQNAVAPEDIGAATAGANFFRSIGGSFGTAVFGALYANEFPRQLVSGFQGHPPAVAISASTLTPQLLHRLPAPELAVVLRAMTNTIQHIYKVATPIGIVAVLVALSLPEIKLRTHLHPVAEEVPMSNADPLA